MIKKLFSTAAIAGLLLLLFFAIVVLATLGGAEGVAASVILLAAAFAIITTMQLRRLRTAQARARRESNELRQSLSRLEHHIACTVDAANDRGGPISMGSDEFSDMIHHALGEDSSDRAAILGKAFGTAPRRFAVVTDGDLQRRLSLLGLAAPIVPNLGPSQLHPDTECIIIDQTCLGESAWQGALDAQHTVTFLDLYSLLLSARERGMPTLVIEDPVSSHFSGDLRLIADTVISSAGQQIACGGRVPTAVVNASVDSLKSRSSKERTS